VSSPIEFDANSNVAVTRADLLGRGARTGLVLLAAGAAAASLAEEADATVPPGDLAWLQLLAGAELLASDFYTQSIGSGVLSTALISRLYRAYFNEQEHYNALSGMFAGAGATVPKSSSFTFGYPHGTGPYPSPSGVFASPKTIMQFAAGLETTMLGAYLGALAAFQTSSLCGAIAQMTACEAEHLAFFTMQEKQAPFSVSFPASLTFADALAAFHPYTTPPLATAPPPST
jgi:Ferritin-like domain